MQTMENNIQKWKNGLSKTRKSTFGKIAAFLGASEINEDTWEELEGLFIQADIGVQTSLDIIDQVKTQAAEGGIITLEDLFNILGEELRERLIQPPAISWQNGPTIILIAGVNGSGKTTTIAKLGNHFQDQGKKVLFIAADTFRAAAIEQLQIWGERLNIPVIAGQKDGDPGAVVYDGIQSALAKKYEVVLIDTAGRLHTRHNLMEELKKVHRVAGKALPGAPHASWLVMDATTGQNALHQAKSFLDVIPLDGIILAKLDSSAKGGMTFAIQEKLNLPILYAGVGEGVQDLVPFNSDQFVSGILTQN
jgi:fused signal recognition particle receptor